MKICTLQTYLCIVFTCIGSSTLNGMHKKIASPDGYSITNKGYLPFIVHLIYTTGIITRKLNPFGEKWPLEKLPQIITIEVTEKNCPLSSTFTPKKPHTSVKIVKSPQDKNALCAIIDNDDTYLLLEAEKATGESSLSGASQHSGLQRPQTAPAHSSRHRNRE